MMVAKKRTDVAVSADPESMAKEGIRKFHEAVTAAVRNQDAAAKASFWTENTRFLPPGREMIRGRTAELAEPGRAAPIVRRSDIAVS